MIGCLPTQALAFLAVFVYATHATQAVAFEWKPGLSQSATATATTAGIACITGRGWLEELWTWLGTSQYLLLMWNNAVHLVRRTATIMRRIMVVILSPGNSSTQLRRSCRRRPRRARYVRVGAPRGSQVWSMWRRRHRKIQRNVIIIRRRPALHLRRRWVFTSLWHTSWLMLTLMLLAVFNWRTHKAWQEPATTTTDSLVSRSICLSN